MSGKAYTMREMRSIVEYLTQQKAYSDIKGRKMWMNFANSQMTSRTWQSLKETFLKRILPDIHNPYYQLTMDQIRSFRQGYDVADRANNKLEIHTISDDSSNNAENGNEKDNEQPSTSNNDNEDKTSGENINCSKITSRNRSSADTYILEKCYETAEDIQRDLESPKLNKNVSKGNEVSDNVQKSTAKSLRDFITYSEPLTPMLQELLDDFASEDESDREPRMEIAEDVTPIDINSQSIIEKPSNAPTDAPNSETVANSEEAKHPSPSKSTTIEGPSNEKEDGQQICSEALTVKNTENDKTQNNNDSIVSADTPKQEENENVTEENMPNSKPQENETETIVINDSEEPTGTESEVRPVSDSGVLKKDENEVSKTNESATQNCSHTTNDSVLPNNPEAFDKSSIKNKQTLKENGNAEVSPETAMEENITTRKRPNSKDAEDCSESKKNKQGCDDDKPIEIMQEEASSVIEINSVTQNSNVSKDNTNMNVKQSSKIEENDKAEPSTSNVGKPKTTNEHEVVEDINEDDDDDDEEIINPCLKSVSLYEEQFNTTKHIDTDYSDVEVLVPNTPVDKNKRDAKSKDVVILKSHSESETDHIEVKVKKPKSATCVSTKVKRDKALANIFGFTTGGITKSRKRDSSYKKSTIHRYDRNTNSFDSSEWTSESDSDDYVSPPRGRKNKHTRKYLKPQFSRVLSLEEDGGLFVMNGKKIFPLIKDGKTVKNYLTYLPDSDKEEDDYWKLKYVEERKKTEELKKFIEQYNKEQTRESKSPILQQTTSRNPNDNLKKQSVPTITTKNDVASVSAEPKANEVENKQENVKLKFTINNEEVQLEGQWSNINPVLEKVMQIFNSNNNKESTQANDSKSKAVQAELKPVSNSGTSTPIVISPVDPEIREKVDQIEKEIFKEIEERDKEDTSNRETSRPVNAEASKPINGESKPVNDQENNVTTRRAKPTKRSITTVPSPNNPAKQKETPEVTQEKVPAKSTKKRRITELENILMSDSPAKFENESPMNETRSLRTRRSNVKETASNTSVVEDNSDVRYKFPPKKNSRVSASKSEKINEKKSNKSKENAKTYLSPDSLSRNSIESTQGYQDSDMSPLMDTQLRRKKKLGLSLQYRSTQKFHRTMRRRSTSCLPRLYFTSDSSNSNIWEPVRKVPNDNSSLNTEVYRSESYQLLLPQPKLIINRLDIIDEKTPSLNFKDQINNKLFSSDNRDINENVTKINNDTIDSNQGSLEAGSSSNVSLPLSPELSIVENLSLSKDMIGNADDPTINETQAEYIPDLDSYQKYLISEVDISVPLMGQECELEENHKDRESNNNLYDPKAGVSDSLLNKIGTVKLNENSTLLHSLDQKLQDLLLESAKKVSPPTEVSQNTNISMEVDVSNSKVTVKTNGKKRCSTPRKRKGTNKSKPPKIDPVIEEEHMELCSRGGRNSCPPYIDVRPIEETIINFDETFFDNTNMQTTASDKPKKKKDIIKVKILRPRDKKRTKGTHDIKKTSENHNKLSVNGDSGISDTGLGISGTMLHDSVDLIHNHSETCLQAHDCLEGSVEFIENSSTSIISIDSCSMQSGVNLWQNVFKEFKDAQDTPPFMIFNNAQDCKKNHIETGLNSPDDFFETPCETVYHSPLATENTSLITEDLSDEIPSSNSHPEQPSTKWYLLSDDETNTMGLQLPDTDFTSSGANLNELFPIACAVPDLSTITEMSRENDDNSRKPTFKDEDTRNDFDSIYTFNCKNIPKIE